MLERARLALDHGEPQLGRAFVVDAIHRLEPAKQVQDAILDAEARTPEAPGTALDLPAWRSV